MPPRRCMILQPGEKRPTCKREATEMLMIDSSNNILYACKECASGFTAAFLSRMVNTANFFGRKIREAR